MNLEQGQKKQGNLDYSEIHYDHLINGNRRNKDTFCCFLYSVSVVFIATLTAVSLTTNNPNTFNLFFVPNPPSSYLCGKNYNFKYAYFYNLLSISCTCVEKCPSSQPVGSYIEGNGIGIGAITVQIDSSGYASMANFTSNDVLSYDSVPALNRLCVPSKAVYNRALKDYAKYFASLNFGGISSFVLDVMNNWIGLLVATGFFVIISAVFMCTIQYWAACSIWSSIIGIILSFFIAAFIFLYNAGLIGQAGAYNGYLLIPDPQVGGQRYYNIGAGIAFGFFVLTIILTLCFKSQINLAIRFLETAAQFVSDIKNASVLLVVPVALILLLWGGFLVTIVYALSSSDFMVNYNNYQSFQRFSMSIYDNKEIVKIIFYIFFTFWTNAVIKSSNIFVVASAASLWFTSRTQQPSKTIYRCYKIIIPSQLGSLALGSLILIFASYLEIIIGFFNQGAQDSNQCTQVITKCMSEIECIVRYSNKKAYIQMAIYGKSFIQSSKDGFDLERANKQYSSFFRFGSLVSFIVSIFIASGTTTIFYVCIIFISQARVNVLQPIGLLIVVFMLSYNVGSLFIDIYGEAMNTMVVWMMIENNRPKGQQRSKIKHEALAQISDMRIGKPMTNTNQNMEINQANQIPSKVIIEV